MKTLRQVEQIAGIAAVVLVFLGCFIVVRPFLSALMWAAILCYATWPWYVWLKKMLGGRRTLAAVLMVLLMTTVMVLPFVLVGMTFADDAAKVIHSIERIQHEGLPAPPEWVGRVPLVGDYVQTYWRDLAASTERTAALAKSLFEQSRRWILRRGIGLGEGICQLTLSVLIAFFYYRSGETVTALVSAGMQRLIGETTQRLLLVVGTTIKNVVYGLIGTALLQGIIAGVCFMIVGVPFALLWALTVFLLSLIPFGPPLVWVPVTGWVFWTGHPGWGIFLVVAGLVAINGIDNLVRPYLISRGGSLPFVLVFLGVLGGIIAFGFIGIFIGPTLLAAGYCLFDELVVRRSALAKAQEQAP